MNVQTGFKLSFLLLMILVMTPTSDAVAPGQNGKIWFSRNGYIHYAEADGSGITSIGVFGFSPVGSPNAAKVAFICNDGDWEICIVDSDGTNILQLTNNNASDLAPAWSPNGARIGFITDRDGNSEIYTMNPDGTDQMNVTNHPADDFEMDWSPDGTQIVFSALRDYNTGFFEIYVMNADGTGAVNITNSIVAEQDPTWSPDGTKIAFSRMQDVWVMDVDGSNQTNLTNLPGANDLAAFWSPDGTRIVFNSDRTGSYDNFIMEADGSNLTNFTNDSEPDYEASWQRLIAQGVCPRPQGVWKNNAAEWPVVLLLLGSHQYTQSELLVILNSSTRKDASIILARQLIAAKLNIAAGSDPVPVQALISEADAILTGYSGKLPYNVKSSSGGGQNMVSIASVLNDYNNGYLTAGCTQ